MRFFLPGESFAMLTGRAFSPWTLRILPLLVRAGVERVLGPSWVASTDGVQEVGSGSGIAGWETVLDNFRSIVEHLVPDPRLGSPIAGMRRIGRWILDAN